MSTFQSNVTHIYGEKGQAWLDELPQVISDLFTSDSQMSYDCQMCDYDI